MDNEAMKWIETKVVFEAADPDMATDLISDIFYQFGLQGVVVETPGVTPPEGWGEDALPMPTAHAVIGYFADTASISLKMETLQKALDGLMNAQGVNSRIFYRAIDEEDWAESWKAYFWPEKVGKRIVIKPTWREYERRPGEIVIEIDPGMAFGTGSHPTTSLCIRMIEDYLEPGWELLDVGTGSGILMIAAGKMGAASVWGVDIDDVAIAVSRKNLLLNGIPEASFRVLTGSLISGISRRFDVVVANILTEIILELMPSIPGVLKSGGLFVASGIIAENRDQIVSALTKRNFDVLEVREKEGWIAVAARFKGNGTPGPSPGADSVSP